jgi:hypothetical protein
LGMPELKLQIWLYRRTGMFAASRPLFFMRSPPAFIHLPAS